MFCDELMSDDLVEDTHDAMFGRTMRHKHHVRYHLFHDRKTELKYDLRQCRHEFTLTQKTGHLGRFFFITRLLYKDC